MRNSEIRNEHAKSNIVFYLKKEIQKLDHQIRGKFQDIRNSETLIDERNIEILNLQAHRQALLERAIDYGYNPEVEEQ